MKFKANWTLWGKISEIENTALCNGFLAVTPETQATKEKNKLDFKIKNICVSKNTIKWKDN